MGIDSEKKKEERKQKERGEKVRCIIWSLLCGAHRCSINTSSIPLLNKSFFLIQERASRAQNMAANSIRWVMGPTGTVISFQHAAGLPGIFNSKTHMSPSHPLHALLVPHNRAEAMTSSTTFFFCSLRAAILLHGRNALGHRARTITSTGTPS